MTTKPIGERVLLPALFVGAVFLSAACGSNEPATPTTPELPPTPSPPTPPAPPPPPEPAGPIVLAVNFDATPLGVYTQQSFDSNWPHYQYVRGLELGLTEVIEGPAAYSGRSLRHKFTGGKRVEDHWIAAKIDLPRSYEELYFSYRVRFEEGFDWVKGGKLPGLFGGRGNTGGNVPDGNDGWSGRMMWRQEGRATQYVYHPDQSGMYGEFYWWEHRFEPGKWHTVEHHFTMNTPGMHDGLLVTWFDGVQSLRVESLRFRDIDTFAIDGLWLTTFFGGGDDTWNATKDEYAYFDDFVVSTERIQQ